MNNDATQVLQSGTTTGGWPIYDTHGITGDGVIVCVADSGIRVTHQVILEPGVLVDHYVPPNCEGELGWGVTNEHGMHVTGTVLGDRSPYNTHEDNDGHAVGARLIFQDIGSNSDDTSVYPSSDLYNDLFALAQYGDGSHIGGAQIHTNSWGGESG